MYADFHRFDDYRSLLKAELDCRLARNALYSLRAFARDLGTSPGTLCDVLKGQQGLSRAKAMAVARGLGLDGADQAHFCDLVDARHARTAAARAAAKLRLKKRRRAAPVSRVRREQFRMIADWYHVALLELMGLPGFELNYDLLAWKLSLPKATIEQAIQRMRELGFVREEGGKLVPHFGDFKIGGDVASQAIRKYHGQLSAKALKALDEQDVTMREFGSVTLAVDPKDLPLAKQRIQAFVAEFSKEFSKAKDKDRLYAMAVQFFALDQAIAPDHARLM